MSTKTYTFTDVIQFTDTTKISNGSLILLNDPNNDFNEDFLDDTGHTYESGKSEFSGGQNQQKNQRPTDSTFGASYTTNINGNFGDGVLSGTAYNGAAAVSGKLDLSGASDKYVDYDADLNADMQQVGCIRFKWTPKYTGGGSFQYLFTIVESAGVSNNRIRIYHQSTLLFYVVSDSTGATIVSVAETFSPIADTEYEVELNWDVTTGATRLFIDGIQLGTTQTGTGTRSADIGLLRLGKDLNGNGSADFLVDDLLIFDTVQHTANYTPGYTVPDYLYLSTYDLLPEMEYTGAGTLIQATNFQTSFTGSPRIAIDIGRSGDYTYWNGSAWVTGGVDYDHATSPADWLTNIATLPVNGEIYGQFIIYYPNSNTQSAFADLIITLTSQIYSTDDPYIIPNEFIGVDSISNIVETVSKTGNDNVKRVCLVGGSPYYYDGSNWVESNYSLVQSNSVAEILAAISGLTTLIGNGTTFAMAYILHSDDGTTTPTITTDIITYDFFGQTDSNVPNNCIIYGTIRDEDYEAIENVTITAVPSIGLIPYQNNHIAFETKTATSRANGYWEIILNETADMDMFWTFYFSNDTPGKGYSKLIPDDSIEEFKNLTDASSTMIISDLWLNQIKKRLGYPSVNTIVLTDAEIKELILKQALYEYFIRFPKILESTYSLTANSESEIDFPDYLTFGCLEVNIVGKGYNSTSGSSFWDLVYYNTIGGGKYSSGGYYGSSIKGYNPEFIRQTRYLQRVASQTALNQSTFKYRIDQDARKLYAFSGTNSTLNVRWAKYSNDFSEVRFQFIWDVVKLCQGYFKLHMADTFSLISDATAEVTVDVGKLEEDGNKLLDEVREKWEQFPHIVVIRD